MDIKVNYAMLERLESRVAEIIEEFEQASARREDLAAAVGRARGLTAQSSKALTAMP